jgi:hypothetical protein
MMNRRPYSLALTALLTGALIVGVVGASAATPPQPGMTYESMKDLPDFSGWWSLMGFPPPPQVQSMKPEVAAFFRGWSAKTAAGTDPEDVDGMKRSYCGPQKFSGFNGGLQDFVEFLFTPGRVTITNELGLVRRIALNAPAPTGHAETNTGASVAHWEGRTLVVETIALNRDMSLNEPLRKLPIKIGRNVRIVERLSLKEPDVLQIVTQVTAPDVYTAPAETTTLYARDRKHVFQEITNCVENDRAFDGATGRERFDMTPPADLPPPPSK